MALRMRMAWTRRAHHSAVVGTAGLTPGHVKAFTVHDRSAAQT
jgi:hypothetical protein